MLELQAYTTTPDLSDTRDATQGLTHAKQALYQLSYIYISNDNLYSVETGKDPLSPRMKGPISQKQWGSIVCYHALQEEGLSIIF